MESFNGDILEQWFSSFIKDINKIIRDENEDGSWKSWIKIAFLLRDASDNYSRRIDILYLEFLKFRQCLSQPHRSGNSKTAMSIKQKKIEKDKKTNQRTNGKEFSRIPLHLCRKGIDIAKDKLLKMGRPPRGIFLKISQENTMDIFLIENEKDGKGQIFGKKSGFLLNQMCFNEDNHEILERKEKSQLYGYHIFDEDEQFSLNEEEINRDTQNSGVSQNSKNIVDENLVEVYKHVGLNCGFIYHLNSKTLTTEDELGIAFLESTPGISLEYFVETGDLIKVGESIQTVKSQSFTNIEGLEETESDNVHYSSYVENCDENFNAFPVDHKNQHENHATVVDNVHFKYIGPVNNENSNQHENLGNTQDSGFGMTRQNFFGESQSFINDEDDEGQAHETVVDNVEDNQEHDFRYIARGYRYISSLNVENHDGNSNASLMDDGDHHQFQGNTQDSGVAMASQYLNNEDDIELGMVNQEETVLDNIHFRYIGPANEDNTNAFLDHVPKPPRTRAGLAQYIANKYQHENLENTQDSAVSQDGIGLDQADFLNQLGLKKMMTNINTENDVSLPENSTNDVTNIITENDFANVTNINTENDFVSPTALVKTPKKRKRRELVFPKPKKAKKVRKIKTHNHNIPNALEMQIEFKRRSNRENHFLEPETLQDFDNNDMIIGDEGKDEEDGTNTVFASKECFDIEKYKEEILYWFETENSMVDFSNKIMHSTPYYDQKDVARLFVATLHLANARKIEIKEKENGDEMVMDDLKINLCK